ncbi:helix-turn-helix domain-containing protein [Spirosoma radiotolerans]|uniref:Transcriptional regulator n=1 Tax=Spirosoma radiotolerans TaxID=1379870 RepID=A0A0E3V704_9BACT|nr:helix-turn-helix domain-containing protein [Spirosoma radiotolerans]AKD55467.1 transcriptional regulator [Spirosoma radiotolerans]
MNNQTVDAVYEANSVNLKLRGFNVYPVDIPASGAPTYRRRDFYKIILSTAHMVIHYANRSVEVNGPFLFFGNPHIPYSVELLSPRQIGYSCLFSEQFLKAVERSESIQTSPLFRIGGTPILPLTASQVVVFDELFNKMLSEQDGQYPFKDELIRNYIQLVVHEALKIQPSDTLIQHKSAASRMTVLFLDLLERQFPIDSPEQPLTLRTAQDYADRLSVHVNHLNRSVKEITGKPTTNHIAERIASEAKALLQHTDWSIAQIAYGLGFAYTTHFNNYFKRVTGSIPKSFRG